jgi:FHA domain
MSPRVTTSPPPPTSSTRRRASCGRSTSATWRPRAARWSSGGGRVGQSFPLHGERLTIGRSPDAEIFLDDVTVSRDHAVLVRRSGEWHLDDSGSLNGTYVNRRRIDSHRLEDGDELQVGKYKLTYLAR